MKSLWSVLIAFSLIVGGCGGGDSAETAEPEPTAAATATPEPTEAGPEANEETGPWTAGLAALGGEPMAAAEVEQWAEDFAAIQDGYMQAWTEADEAAIRSLYTSDIVHDDNTFREYLEGLDEIAAMAPAIGLGQFSHVEGFESGLIGGDGGMWVTDYWGNFGRTEEDPFREVDRLTLDGDLISYWELFYADAANDPFKSDVTISYGEAWSSAAPEQLEALYDAGVVRRDTVLGLQSEGYEAVQALADHIATSGVPPTWELQIGFDNGMSGSVAGGLFTVTDENGCQVAVGVVLEAADDKIIDEDVFYDGAALIDCGWVS